MIVTAWPDTADRVAVTVAIPPASAMGLPVRFKVTAGGGSLSVIVPVPVAVAMEALVGLERLTEKVSFASSRTSPFTRTVKVLVVSPGLKVSVVVGMAT